MVHGISVHSSNLAFGDNIFSKMNDVRGLKHNLTLDLQIGANKSKRNKFSSGLHEAPLLSTPDYKNFNLNSSEVEKMLSETGSSDLLTPTPNTMRTLLFGSKSNVDDAGIYNEDGLANVLSNLNHESSQHDLMNGLNKSNNSNSNSNLTMTNYDYENQYPATLSSNYSMESSPLQVKIKDEPQTVPNIVVSPPVSPINMDSQERIKADRKKARNRLAAAKCRKKKLERIACLETRVKELKDENSELGQKQASLKKEVLSLKERIVRHYENGCSIVPLSVPLY